MRFLETDETMSGLPVIETTTFPWLLLFQSNRTFAYASKVLAIRPQ